MTAVSATVTSGFLAFRVKCCNWKPRRGFGNQKDDNKLFYVIWSRKSITKQSNPPSTQVPIISSRFDVKSNKSIDIDFEERLEAVRRSALEQKKAEEEKEFGAIDYDAPVESEKKQLDLAPSVSPTDETEVVSNKLSEEEKSTLQSRLKQYETTLSASPKDPTALEPIHSNGLVGSWCDLGRIRTVYSGCLCPSGLGKGKPSDPDVLRLLGEVKYELKDYEGSAAAYRLSAMVSCLSTWYFIWCTLAVSGLTNALLAAKKPDEAVVVLLDSRERLNAEKSDIVKADNNMGT
ncbi:hypothetical protein Dsin_012997 [Dipteronia sinensis]|uniref:Uncharacterized protein n=1 Tax=Dipteronia sinensis TaxID=43782 RepID=A0AAE0AKF4_9ROSI|nr:hypothetical protein Dsin_012997 [Dipteronia sinensis]